MNYISEHSSSYSFPNEVDKVIAAEKVHFYNISKLVEINLKNKRIIVH